MDDPFLGQVLEFAAHVMGWEPPRRRRVPPLMSLAPLPEEEGDDGRPSQNPSPSSREPPTAPPSGPIPAPAPPPPAPSPAPRDNCPICQTEEVAVATNCQHRYCGPCIRQSYTCGTYSNHRQCPLCRAEITGWTGLPGVAAHLFTPFEEVQATAPPPRHRLADDPVEFFPQGLYDAGYGADEEEEYEEQDPVNVPFSVRVERLAAIRGMAAETLARMGTSSAENVPPPPTYPLNEDLTLRRLYVALQASTPFAACFGYRSHQELPHSAVEPLISCLRCDVALPNSPLRLILHACPRGVQLGRRSSSHRP